MLGIEGVGARAIAGEVAVRVISEGGWGHHKLPFTGMSGVSLDVQGPCPRDTAPVALDAPWSLHAWRRVHSTLLEVLQEPTHLIVTTDEGKANLLFRAPKENALRQTGA